MIQRLYHDTTPNGQALAPITIQNFVSRHSVPSAARPSRARRSPLHEGRPYRSAVSCAWLAVSWRASARPCAPLRCPALLCHDTINCIVTQHQTWAVAHPIAKNCFFFHIIFFLICSPTRRPKKNLLSFFCSFSSRTK